LNRALYRGKKEIDHEDCEDNGGRLVLPFCPDRNVSEKITYFEMQNSRSWLVTHGEEEASNDDGGQEVLKEDVRIKLQSCSYQQEDTIPGQPS
jgi:hypothetical protein